ncbi:MAG: GNAT family N-acetyltransferase [Chloroflexi bacterium]|nr:GNAT family N-acetyltransferase [Chloroflexota bacterium]
MEVDLAGPLPDIAVGPFDARNPGEHEVPALAELMFVSYAGSIDDEGWSVEETQHEVAAFADGKYGPPLWECSFVAMVSGRPASAVLLCEENGVPLLAYVYTHPEFRGRGLVTGLVQRALTALRHRGYAKARLRVTIGNAAAEHVYRKLGFVAA